MNELRCPQKSCIENYTIGGGVVGREQENLCVCMCYLNDRKVENDWAEIK